MSETATRRTRRGARAAMIERRKAPLPEALRPVKPGLSGGHYQLLSPAEIEKIHHAALEILATIGLADALPSCIDAITAMGGEYKNNRLLFPQALIEDTLAQAARHFVLHGQTPEHDMQPWDKQVYFGTAGAAVHIVNPETGEYRDSTLLDLYNIARLIDALEHVHFFQRPVVARDLTNSYELDVNTCYASVSGTAKHVGTSFVKPKHVEACLSMLHEIAGSEQAWRARPFVSQSNCFVVPPLRFAQDACTCLESAVQGGMPVLLLSAAQAGATSPAALAGTVAQATAEVLAGLVYVNALKPGHPAIFGTWPFVSDLRTGAMSGGSGEQTLLMAACAQMAQFYDLAGGVCGGISDSKLPDAQMGFERGYSHALVANAGANLIYEAAGMHASLLGFCLESAVMDNDAIGSALRTVRGIEVNDETLSIETIRDVCLNGPVHYLGHAQTLSLMQTEYLYPDIADRSSPKEWVENGSLTILQRASKKTQTILAEHYPALISETADRNIRAKFPIRLDHQHMRRQHG